MAKNTKPGARKAKAAAPKAAKSVARKRPEDTSGYPALGRAFGFVERPGAGRLAVIALGVIFAGLLLADLLYYKKTYVDVEKVFGFYALYGLAVGVVAVIVAKLMRLLLKRREDYYASNSTEVEDYPEAGLQRETHNG